MRGYRPIATEEDIELDRFPEFENARGDGLTEEEELVIKRQLDVPNEKPGYSTLLRQATRTEIFIMLVSFAMSIVEGASLPLMMIAYGSFAGSSTSFSTNKLASELFETHINKVALYYICLGIEVFICNYIGTFSLSYTAERITERLRQRYMRALFRQNIGFFDFLGSGEVTTRITSDMVLIQSGLGQKAFLFASAISRSIAALVISLSQGWKLTLILLEPTLAMASMVIFCSKRMRDNQTRAMEEYASASTFAEEVFSSARNFTAYGMQKRLQSKYKVYLDKASRWDYRSKLWLASMIAAMMGVLNLQYALAFWQGDQFLRSGQLSVSNILTIVSCTTMAGLSFANSLPHFQAFVQAITAATKVFNVIQRKSPVDPGSYDGKIPADISGNIDFVKIKHVYPARRDVIVLKEFNLSIKSGMVVALVGASGSGKSTILGLLERFYLPVTGQILLDGTDISTLNLRWLRSQISIVTQEPVLFNVSIYESIEHGLVETKYEHASNTVKRELIENAARLADAHNFIMELPAGYQTKVGDCGSLLSGGQKQRIAIARATVSNPKILLLDEATAALDAKSEKIVQEAVNKASRNRTTIIVAHRLSTITNADMIVVMAGGQIVEQGNHDELIKRHGTYESMIKAQELRTHIESTNRPSGMLAGCEVSSELKRVATDTAASRSMLPIERHMEKPLTMCALIRFGWNMNKKEHGLMQIGFVLCMLAGASRSFQAISYGNSITSLSSPETSTGGHSISFWCFLYLILGIAVWLVYFLLGFTLSKSSALLISRVREKAFNAILRQDIAFFDGDAITSGSLVSFLSLEANRLASISGSTLGTIITACATLAMAIVVGFLYGWKLTLLSASTTPIVFGCGYFRFYALREIEKHTKESTDAASFACEVASSMPTVASLSLEFHLLKQYHSKVIKQAHRSLHYLNISAALYATSKGLYMFILAFLFWYGGRLMLNLEYTLLQFYIITGAILAGSEDVSSAFSFAPEISGAAAAALLLKTSLSHIPTIDTSSPKGKKIVCLSGKVEFRCVHFSYPGHTRRRVLCGTTFTVKPGQFVALVGPSGSGKSTVMALLERFYDPTGGLVLVDDMELRDYNIQDYRAQLAIVSQEMTLYTGTIRENILADMDDIDDDFIAKACKDANIYGFIMSLPEGFNTVVGTKGILLSGGQRQRIAIARALLRNPKILLLDEATSALDSTSERLVQNALDAASHGRTTIAIAHRLSTIQHADAIYVFSEGTIVEQGKHDELILRRGVYWELAKLQGKEMAM